ncbi:hypothetical protein [Paenarthrobacter nicotinovorans]|uniref:hypothetical protein n=1 Tax=Paenarthrobacter nicotinovorans TaxID=29320 RepID=UPI0021B3F815|nr:hypothetical protein [Paenarthrobacter nicotinovorans]
MTLPAAALSALALAGCSGAPTSSAPGTTPAPTASATPTGPSVPTWGLDPASAAGRIQAAGLPVLTAEGTAEHFHAHLDVVVHGKPVTVPEGIGITLGPDGKPNGISSLHTHDTSGIIHIEAPTVGQRYTLGQVLQEWGMLGGTGCIGPECSSEAGKWTVYVNGKAKTWGLTEVVLAAHDEIALVYGNEVAMIQPKYAFPPGL